MHEQYQTVREQWTHMWGYCSRAQKNKNKKKKGRKRRRDETRYPNTHLVSSGLVIFIDFVILLQYYYEKL